MNKYDKSLKVVDELFKNTTKDEFERDYLEVECGIGITIDEYLNKDRQLIMPRVNLTDEYGATTINYDGKLGLDCASPNSVLTVDK